MRRFTIAVPQGELVAFLDVLAPGGRRVRLHRTGLPGVWELRDELDAATLAWLERIKHIKVDAVRTQKRPRRR